MLSTMEQPVFHIYATVDFHSLCLLLQCCHRIIDRIISSANSLHSTFYSLFGLSKFSCWVASPTCYYLTRTNTMLCSPAMIIIVLAAIVLVNIKLLHYYYREDKNIYFVNFVDVLRPVFRVRYHT